MRGDCGGSKIHRHAIDRPLIKTGPQMDDLRMAVRIGLMDRAGHFPTALAQNWLHLRQYGEIGLHIFQLPLAL